MTLVEIIDAHPWMHRHLMLMRFGFEEWRAARRANPAWPSLSKYGKLVWFIVHQVGYIPEPKL